MANDLVNAASFRSLVRLTCLPAHNFAPLTEVFKLYSTEIFPSPLPAII